MTRPVVAVPRRGATAADRRAVQQANAIRAQAAASQPSMLRSVLADSLRRLAGQPGLGGAAKDAAQPVVNFVRHPGVGTGIQALATLPIGGMRGAAEHGDYLYHATTPEGAAAIQASGHILPGDVRGEGQPFAWVSADPAYAQGIGQGTVLVRIPRANIPANAIRSRFGPETYASPTPIPVSPILRGPR